MVGKPYQSGAAGWCLSTKPFPCRMLAKLGSGSSRRLSCRKDAIQMARHRHGSSGCLSGSALMQHSAMLADLGVHYGRSTEGHRG